MTACPNRMHTWHYGHNLNLNFNRESEIKRMKNKNG